ncbi:MAG: pyridoxal-phosphate dependent enzyme [Chloroflexi bacterium]|nr:pyridoxal-phosphate dependent enzyme [Chloroflexota bacterium]MBU1751406.1 pyridoxal-phosphate dependent enzyme [Chloroflexota bacterium]
MSQPKFHLHCTRCGWQEPYQQPRDVCPQCQHDWLNTRYDYPAVRQRWEQQLAQRPFDMWRYHDLLPLCDDCHRLSMGEGGTPLYPTTNLSMMLNRPHIYVKDERQNPTSSFKDRQASLAISVMREQGITEAVVASTGNVAISYSAYSTRAGIKLWTFLTSAVPAAKMREVALYGSEVIKVTATYDETKKVAINFAKRRGLLYDRGLKSIAARESMKTLAFEVAEQLTALLGPDESGRWRAPDWYFQAVSGGLGPVGVWQGFEELLEMGLISHLPKLACIQAEGCAPMVHSFRAGLAVAEPVLVPNTRIATVATGDPGAAYTFLRQVILEHGGTFEMVSDQEAFQAMHVLAKMDGISMEPAAAIAFAGLFNLTARGVVQPQDVVVINCSGHTFPVEKFLLGDEYARSVEVADAGGAETPPPEEGLLASLERLDRQVRRVAIIEDNPEAARLLRRVLQAHGEYQIDEAYDGEAGLELVRQSPPDLILLDLMMPKMDGFTFIEALKADERLSSIPVVVITAQELTAHERQRLNGHVRGLLQKGTFLSTDLLDDIQELLK